MTSKTGQAELILRPTVPVRGLVLFMHGFASDQNQIVADPSFLPLRNALISAGFAIVSSNAHGNNAGNAASVQDQQNAVADARAAIGVAGTVHILAFSMGGLDALLTAASHAISGLQSLALLSPATNTTAFLDTGYRDAISEAFGDPAASQLASVVAKSNPLLRPGNDYLGYDYRFWSSPEDPVVPASQTSAMVGRLVAAGVTATAAPLSGGHGDFSLLRPAQVVDLFEGTGSS